MSRRIVLVDLPWSRPKDPPMSLGHASLLATLRSRTSAEVRSVVVPFNEAPSVSEIADRVMAETAGANDADVAMGVYVWSDRTVGDVAIELRKRGHAGRIILGGPQITYASAGVDRLYPQANCFVRGYGESALCHLVEHPYEARVQGVHFAGASDRCEIAFQDPDLLVSPWLSGTIPVLPGSFIRWETQRGCRYACSFCQHRHPGRRPLRYDFALERLLAEVDRFCSAGVADIAIVDPIFHANPHAEALLAQFAENHFRGRLSVQCRAETTNERFLDRASHLDVRLEFGLQTIHHHESRAVRRANDVRKVDRTLRAVRAREILHEVSLIYGLPEQTLSSFIRSVAWCLERQVPVVKAFPLMLLRGTALDAERQRWGLVESDEIISTVVQSSTFDRQHVAAMDRIARALQETEGRHPQVADLLALADVNGDAATSAGEEAA